MKNLFAWLKALLFAEFIPDKPIKKHVHLAEDDVINAYIVFQNGASINYITRTLNISTSTAYKIKKGSHKHLKNYDVSE